MIHKSYKIGDNFTVKEKKLLDPITKGELAELILFMVADGYSAKDIKSERAKYFITS